MPEGEVVDLKAHTQCVSADGALIVMEAPLLSGQLVRLINEMTSEFVDCYVTSVRDRHEARYIGVGFILPKHDFWHVVFPKSGTRQAVRSARTGGLMAPNGATQIPPEG
jgi:hypothetical protein